MEWWVEAWHLTDIIGSSKTGLLTGRLSIAAHRSSADPTLEEMLASGVSSEARAAALRTGHALCVLGPMCP